MPDPFEWERTGESWEAEDTVAAGWSLDLVPPDLAEDDEDDYYDPDDLELWSRD